jgi:hypothetical protein
VHPNQEKEPIPLRIFCKCARKRMYLLQLRQSSLRVKEVDPRKMESI